jgi:hypothetical protein
MPAGRTASRSLSTLTTRMRTILNGIFAVPPFYLRTAHGRRLQSRRQRIFSALRTDSGFCIAGEQGDEGSTCCRTQTTGPT